VGGIARIDLTVVSFDIAFGTPREQAKIELIESWEEFCRSFLKASGAKHEAIDKPVDGPSFIQLNLVSGRNNVNTPPLSREELEASPPETRREPVIWKVRGDELELAASTAVPVTELTLGGVKGNSQVEGVQDFGCAGKSLLVPKAVVLASEKLTVKNYAGDLGVHPMGKKLKSALNVTIVRDDASAKQPEFEGWTIVEDRSSLPAALWDPAVPNPKGPTEPTAKLIPNCITGIKSLKPPVGKWGRQATLSELCWETLDPVSVARSGASLEAPSKTRSRSVQAAVAGKQAEQKLTVEALAALGFKLDWKPAPGEVRFRELHEEPLTRA